MLLCRSMTSLIYHAITLNTNSLSGDRFLNAFFAAFCELVACIICYLISERVEQRYVFISSIAVAALAVGTKPFLADREWLRFAVLYLRQYGCCRLLFLGFNEKTDLELATVSLVTEFGEPFWKIKII